MGILRRYLFREILEPLLIWIGFLFLLLFALQFLRGSDVLLGSAVTGLDLLRFIVYLAPHFLVMALPIAFLLGVLLGLGRLSDDGELAAMQALGVSPRQLLVGPVTLGVSTALVLAVLVSSLQPWGLRAVRMAVNEVIKRNLIGDVKPGVFYDDIPQLTLYVQGVRPGGREWSNVLLHDERDPEAPLLLLARQGQVNTGGAGAGMRLRLSDGQLHLQEGQRQEYSVAEFERGEVAVGVGDALWQKNQFRSYRDELTPGELVREVDVVTASGGDPRPLWVTLHKRIGQVLSPIAFAVLGAPLAIGRRGAGRARGFVLTLLGVILHMVLTRTCEGLATRGHLPPVVAAQVANVVFVALGLWAIRRVGAAAR